MEVLVALIGIAGAVLITLAAAYWITVRDKSDWWLIPAVVLCVAWVVLCSMLATPVLDPIWTKVLERKVTWEV